MMSPLIPANEATRLAALHQYDVLDSMPEDSFDDLAKLAAHICGMPIALVSLVDKDRQWFKSRYGLGATQTPRDISFCGHAILQSDVFVVPDTLEDERFADNPLVTGEPKIRSYAGAPLVNKDGLSLGTLCVIDRTPHVFDPERMAVLSILARQTVLQMELRMQARELTRVIEQRELAQKQRDEMEGHLRHAQKLEAVGSLAAGIAHEINTPMQFIGDNIQFAAESSRVLLSLVDTACRAASGDPTFNAQLEAADLPFIASRLPRAFERCADGVSRVSHIVEAMKGFSSPHSDMIPTDLNQCVRDTLLVSHNEYKFVAEMVTHYGDIPPVIGNAGDLNQVFLNLIVNATHAIEATGRKGTISIRSELCGESVVIRIQDNGCGIPEAICNRVYDPFFTTKEVGKGTGQGLSIARSIIVERHRGSLEFVSEEGKGTCFTVSLPVAAAKLAGNP